MAKLKVPQVAGFYKAKVQGAWEPVSVFKNRKRMGVILIGDTFIYAEGSELIEERIEEFGEKIEFPEE